MLLEVVIRLGEMSAADKPAIRAQWAGVHRRQYQVPFTVNKLSLALRITAPKHKDYMLTLPIKCLYSRIRQFFPTFALMATCLMRLDSKRSIKQKHTLLCPMRQIARRRNRFA